MKGALHVVIILFFVQMAITIKAQQRVQFSQYMVNQYVLNPAVGGVDADLDLTMAYRKQWVNFNGGPVTYYFSGNAPIKVQRKPGLTKPSSFQSLGGLLYNDQTGPLSKLTFLGSYSYNLPVHGDLRFAAGIFAGITQLKLNQGDLNFDQIGESFSYATLTVPDGSLGLWLYNHSFYTGVSVNQLFYNTVNFVETGTSGSLVYHYYLTAGYKIPLGDMPHKIEDWELSNYLVPSIMLKYGAWGAPPSVDLNLKFHFLHHFWVGTSYRHLDSQVILAGLQHYSKDAGIVELAYSYDYTLSKINRYTAGSHEITLKYKYRMQAITCPKAFW